MILPIVAYGSPILKQKCAEITPAYPNLKQLIADMWETMYHAHGVGLAAPQIGHAIRLFMIDSLQLAKNAEDDDEDKPFLKNTTKKIFINPQIIKTEGDEWAYNEGCLSIPHIRENVYRPEKITIQYHDENFVEHTDSFDTINARIIQHEYDHIEGILFTDHLKPLRRKLLKKRLEDISSGRSKTDYRMRFAVKSDL